MHWLQADWNTSFGLFLDRSNLKAAELEFANLENFSLRDAYLGFTCTKATYMIGAHLVDTNLIDRDLSWANLQNTYLTGSVMLGMNLRAVVLTCNNLQEIIFRNARLERPVRGKQN